MGMRAAIGVVAAAAVLGCSTVSRSQRAFEYRPDRGERCDVEQGEDPPARPSATLGVVPVLVSAYVPLSRRHESVRKLACRLGADGVWWVPLGKLGVNDPA